MKARPNRPGLSPAIVVNFWKYLKANEK